MSRLGCVRARALLALKSLSAHLAPTRVHPSTSLLNTDSKERDTHLAFQIKRGSIRVRAFRPQLRRKRTQRLEHALALSSARGDDARAELLRRVRRRRQHRGVVVDPRIHEQRAARRCRRRRRRTVVAAGAKPVDAAGLDVDARDLGPVVCCEYRELDRAAPGVRREDCADVFVAWTPFRRPPKKK